MTIRSDTQMFQYGVYETTLYGCGEIFPAILAQRYRAAKTTTARSDE